MDQKVITKYEASKHLEFAWGRKADQQTAEYNPLGGLTGGQACANCLFFISPNDCTVVESYPSAISPTGKSRFWTAIPEHKQEPLEVIIVEDSTGERELSLPHISQEFLSQLEDAAKQTTKTEDGTQFSASDFAVVPDSDKPSTWKLRLAEGKTGALTVAQIGRAITAMQPGGFRGNRVQLSGDDKSQAVSRITSAVNKVDATDDQKQNLRERLGKVKEVSGSGILDWFKNALVAQPLAEERGQGFQCYKGSDGQWWWSAFVSNNFRDQDTPPEIFSEKAHQDYIARLDAGIVEPPELWYWHIPGTKFGKAKWVGYNEGLLWAAGTIDPGMEDVAQQLAQRDDLLVSHGYRDFSYSDKASGIIGQYTMFEISPLPGRRAANRLTGWSALSLKEVTELKITAEKRQELVDTFGQDRVSRFEQEGDGLLRKAQELGLEQKDLSDGPGTGGPSPTIDYTAMGQAAAKAMAESEGWKTLNEKLDAVKANSDQVPALIQRMDTLEAEAKKSDETKVDGLLASRYSEAMKGNGHQASQDAGNAITKEQADAAGFSPPTAPIDPQFMQSVVGAFEPKS